MFTQHRSSGSIGMFRPVHPQNMYVGQMVVNYHQNQIYPPAYGNENAGGSDVSFSQTQQYYNQNNLYYGLQPPVNLPHHLNYVK